MSSDTPMVAAAMYSQTRSESGDRKENSDGGSRVGLRYRMLMPETQEGAADGQHIHPPDGQHIHPLGQATGGFKWVRAGGWVEKEANNLSRFWDYALPRQSLITSKLFRILPRCYR